VRVSDAGRDALRRAGGRHVLDEVGDASRGRRLASAAGSSPRPQLHQLGAQPLVDDEVDCRLDDAVVGRRQTAVEAAQALLTVDPAYALQRRQRTVSPATQHSPMSTPMYRLRKLELKSISNRSINNSGLSGNGHCKEH